MAADRTDPQGGATLGTAVDALLEAVVNKALDRLVVEAVAEVMDGLAAMSTPDASARLLSVEQAAEYLSVSRTLAYELLASGDLDSVHIGSRRLVPVVSLVRFIAEQTACGSGDTSVLFNDRREE